MFSGIVQGKARIISATRHGEVLKLHVEFPSGALNGVQIGASISLAGCCLTLVESRENAGTFDLVPETQRCTSLGQLKAGDEVNFERSLKMGDEIGGHLVSGHVDTTGVVRGVVDLGTSREIEIGVPAEWRKFILDKGYIAVDGASLTVVRMERDSGILRIALIPETLRVTTFGDCDAGQLVNIEVDRSTQVIVNTVERVLGSRVT